MADTFKASVVQTASVAFDAARTINKVEDYVRRAASEGSSLVVFPEAFIGGHTKGLDYGFYLGGCTDKGREIYERYYSGAIDIDGPEVDRLAQIAADHKTWLVTGAIERDASTLYCTVLFFSPEGVLVDKHRKLTPTGTERILWGYADGSTMPVLDTPLGKIGACICWENYMPMLRLAMYGKGISLYCAPTADHRETWLPLMRHIAREGRCYVLSACQYGTRADFPDDYPLDPDVPADTILARGGSCIIDPFGNVLSAPVFDTDLIHTAVIDPGAITRARFDFDVAGHSGRPDLFTLRVDERKKDVQFTLPL